MTTSITSTCACGSFNLQVDYQSSSLPLDRALCLCNSCRRLSGSCGVSYILVPSTQPIDIRKFQLTSYQATDRLTRFFCSTCGAHTLVFGSRNQTWHLATGLWDRTEGIINWTGCKWAEDTLDGGVSIWLRDTVRPDGKREPLQRWMSQDWGGGQLVPDHIPLDVLPEEKMTDANSARLEAQCRCGGVKFYITRPNENSKKIQALFPDLIVPYHSHSPENPKNETWWLCENDTKYLAGICACRSCRAASGFEIQPWAFVPTCNLENEDGSPIVFDMGTLKSFESSKDIWREFCRCCGATVFWHCKQRPDLIDVSVGLLDPKEGARVERWLIWWTRRVSFGEMAVSKSLIRSLEEGLKRSNDEKAWKEKRY